MMRDDNSYRSSNIPGKDKLVVDKDYNIYKAMVTRVYPIDDNGNNSKGAGNQEVTYDLMILGGERAGQQVSNARDITFAGGVTSYSEKIWRACTNPNFQRDNGGLDISQQDGDVVTFYYLNGNPLYPMIMGGATHYQNNGKTGATKSQMPRLLFEYNGINVLIDNQGQLFVTHKGGKANAEKGAFAPNAGFESIVQLSEQQVIIKDSSGNIITVDAPSKSIIIETPKEFRVTSETMNLIARESYSLTTKTAVVNASISHTLNTPDSTVNASANHNINSPETNINIGHAEGEVNVNGTDFKVVSTNSYDPFLMAPHMDGYSKFKTKG